MAAAPGRAPSEPIPVAPVVGGLSLDLARSVVSSPPFPSGWVQCFPPQSRADVGLSFLVVAVVVRVPRCTEYWKIFRLGSICRGDAGCGVNLIH